MMTLIFVFWWTFDDWIARVSDVYLWGQLPFLLAFVGALVIDAILVLVLTAIDNIYKLLERLAP